MARKPKTNARKADDTTDDVLMDPPSSINPYDVLSIQKSATQDEIKKAYRKAALKYHPDKANAEDKDNANKKFQEVAFAYAILSDERRRKRYDTTGNTAESLNADDDDFDWVEYFREQTATMVDGDMIEKIKQEYQGSTEERDDVLRVYSEFEGDMDAIYEEIMCSNVLEDDKRFRGYIDEAIQAGEVEKFKTYAKETKDKRKKRIDRAKNEEQEAMELAEELGVKDKLFGKEKGSGRKKTKNNDEDALKALIQQRQKDRSENFFDQLEAKYGGRGGSVGTKKGKRPVDEPPEEMFQKNAKKSKGSR